MSPIYKRLCALVAATVGILPLTGKAQGSLTYQTTQFGQEDYVFMPDPHNPTVAKYGGRIVEYAGFRRVEGPGFYAELWWAPTQDPTLAIYAPIPRSKVTFRSGTTAGLINGWSKLEIPETYGGDIVLLQLRVWENLNGTIQTWEQALTTSGIIRGETHPFLHELAGVDRSGNPKLGSGSIAGAVPNFSLAVTIPEPHSVGWALFGLSLLWIRRPFVAP